MIVRVIYTFGLLSTAANPNALLSYRFPCYFTNWAQYRPGYGKFLPELIPSNLCTHGVYAFAKLENNTIQPYEWNDQDVGGNVTKGLYFRFNSIKTRNRAFKTLLAIGGWNARSEEFSSMVSTNVNRTAFVVNAITYLQRWNFDGLDLDWEYPTVRGGRQKDRELFTVLLQELHAAFINDSCTRHKEKLLITIAISAGPAAHNYYELQKIASYVDFVNVMTYDYHGSFDEDHKAGFNSPLFPDLIETIRNLTGEGLPRRKINIGLASYGRSLTLASVSDNTPGANFTSAGNAGEYTRSSGFLSFYEICTNIRDKFWIKVWNFTNMVPYAYKGKQWVGYDDPRSVQAKVDYMKKEMLGGVFLWSYDLDDFNNICGGGRYPIANSAKKTLHCVGEN